MKRLNWCSIKDLANMAVKYLTCRWCLQVGSNRMHSDRWYVVKTLHAAYSENVEREKGSNHKLSIESKWSFERWKRAATWKFVKRSAQNTNCPPGMTLLRMINSHPRPRGRAGRAGRAGKIALMICLWFILFYFTSLFFFSAHIRLFQCIQFFWISRSSEIIPISVPGKSRL